MHLTLLSPAEAIKHANGLNKCSAQIGNENITHPNRDTQHV